LITKKRAKTGAIFSFPSVTSQEGQKIHVSSFDRESIEGYGREWFEKKNWKVAVQEDTSRKTIVGNRGNIGFWGSIFFHFILITALMGLVIYYFGAYRATLGITEGQSFRLQRDRFAHILEEPVWGLGLPNAEVGLLKQYSIYSEDDPLYPIEHVAVFRVRDINSKRTWEKEVRINDPLEIDGKRFLLQRGGFSPRIVINNSAGRLIFDKFVALRNERGTEDNITIEEEDIQLKIKFYPDLVRKGESFDTKSLQIKNPFYMLTVYRQDAHLFNELVPFNGMAKAAGYQIHFPEVRRWVEMELVGEPGIGFFFIVSFIGLFGVLIRMIDPDERIYIILEEAKSGVDMTSYTYSKHFSGLIEDKRNDLVKYIEERVQGSEGPRG
jgi:cytochrome c biogenesis protein ResB